MTSRNDVSRTQWSAPKLIQKPLDETLNGTGTTGDGTFEMQS